jgi:hypothetical protein
VLTGWFPNVKLVGDRPATEVAPVPESDTDWGLLAALSTTVREPERLPVADGLNVMLMAQFAPAASKVPQLLDWVKSAAFEPETEMPVMPRAALPELLRVTT